MLFGQAHPLCKAIVQQLDVVLEPVRVRATQGSANVHDQMVTLNLGRVENAQDVLVEIEARVAKKAAPGTILLTQATAEFTGGSAISDVLAVGLPPVILPATGVVWRPR